MYDVGVYKSGSLLVVQKDLRIRDQIGFMLQPKLFFGVVRNIEEGDVFTSLEIISALTEFDLSNFPNGINVTLRQLPGDGQFEFTAESK